tara:strand:- start:161 stop:1147 length:987 start_codon:yes stop_codon:yes gene_type:complete
MIISKTPYRISFFGGGTDLNSWLNNGNEGLILSTSINKYCYITLRDLPKIFNFKYRLRYYINEEANNIKNIKHNSIRECLNLLKFQNQPLELVHHGELPSQSGLGSSSTFTVGLIKSLYEFKKQKISKRKLCQKAIFIEQDILKESVGKQDHIAAAYGGFNIISMQNQKFRVKKLNNNKIIKKIENNIILLFTSLQRNSEPLEKKKSSKIFKGEKNDELNNILNITKEAILEINSENFSLQKFGKLLSENWKYKKMLHKNVTNSNIDEMYEKVMSLGAYGGKLLGSGNGGFFLFVCPTHKTKQIENIFKSKLIKNIKFDLEGSHIIYS